MSESKETTNAEPSTPATAGKIKSIIRSKLRKREEHMEMGLNIYPMMDMMTILLVFLIQQFADQSANFTQSQDLQIPYSVSKKTVEDALNIQIAKTDLVVNGKQIIPLKDGTVDNAHKQGGGNGFLIQALFAEMQIHRDRLKKIETITQGKKPFTGEIQIISDKDVPFRTISEVIYSIGQAEFSKLHFVVLEEPKK